jgi:hypothetical protein
LITVKAGSIVAEPMDLERACEVLSKAQHHHCSWRPGKGSTGATAYGTSGVAFSLSIWSLTEFEAIAIAEKYEREGLSENQSRGMPTVRIDTYRDGTMTINQANADNGWS